MMTPQARIWVRARQRTIGKRHDRSCLHVQRTLAYFGRFERRSEGPQLSGGRLAFVSFAFIACPGHMQIRDEEIPFSQV